VGVGVVGGLRVERHRDDLGLADGALRPLGGLQPELLGRGVQRVVEARLGAPGRDDLVSEQHVVARPDLDDVAAHVRRPRLEQRFEHARAGMGEDVGRPTLARLADARRLRGIDQVHRDITERVAGRALDDRQVDVERSDADPRRDPVGIGARRRGRGGR
jgi:hypothetical protein